MPKWLIPSGKFAFSLVDEDFKTVSSLDLISRFRLEGLKMKKRQAFHMQSHIPKPNFSHLPGGKQARRDTSRNFTSPAAFASPASESFSKRTDKGKLLAEINGSEIIECATDQAELSTLGSKGEKYHYMAQKLKDINEIVQDYITDKINFMAQKLDTGLNTFHCVNGFISIFKLNYRN